MEIGKAWTTYVNKMSQLDATATNEIKKFVENYPGGFKYTNKDQMQDLISYAYGISTKYGEGAAALACEMYDAIGLASGLLLDAAIPADTADYGDVAKAIYGTVKSENIETISGSIGRLVKMAGADTTLMNSIRDGAEFAWIPSGDTCAFCIALASRGWQPASMKALKNGHAEHIHSNCDCQYAIRFNGDTSYENYNPEKYKKLYYGAKLRKGEYDSAENRINALRRQFYEENKEEINAQKRSAYEKRQELNDSRAEEINVNQASD